MNRMNMMWRMTVGALLLASGMAFGQREVNDFNRDWRFTKGEQPDAVRQPGFDDSGWQAVRLPHDWAIAGPFDPSGNGGTGETAVAGSGLVSEEVYAARRGRTARLLRFRRG